MHITRPITSLTTCGTNQYWVSPSDSRRELDQYAPSGTYDSIFVYWPQTNFSTGQQIPSCGWGLSISAGSWSNGATYATVANGQSGIWRLPTVGEVWLHEWLHGVCDYYKGKGYTMPNGCSDGGASHGYSGSPTDGWATFYRDLMTGRVLENSSYTGITADAWRSGDILNRNRQVVADYFYSDTTASYQRVGTVIWQNAPATEQYVALGTSVANDNKMYFPVNFGNRFMITGRLYIPGSGVGSWDSVAIALRDSQVEYWASLLYGTNLAEKNNLDIMRNDAHGTLYPLTLTSGWYTVKVLVDYPNSSVRMKAWSDGTNEPSAWQISRALDAGWVVSQIGFRHYGQGARVDDLLVQEVTQNPATTTNVNFTINPSVFGQSVTFTASVTSTGGIPTGTVTFKDGATTLGTGTLSGSTATFTTSVLTVGSHDITAIYAGDTNFNSSTSAILIQVVNKANTTTNLISSPNPSVVGQTVIFTATVSIVSPGSGTPTGTVTFKDGTVTLGTTSLTGGVATLTTSSLSPGNHSVTATYSGNTNFASSTSVPLVQTVNPTCTPIGAPPAPVLLSPPEGGTVNTVTPTLDWADIPSSYCVDYFNILINEDGVGQVDVAWPSTSNYTVPAGKLITGRKYSWWLWAHNSLGFGNGSARSFWVNTDSNNGIYLPFIKR